MSAEGKVRAIVAQQFGVGIGRVGRKTTFEELKADPLQMVGMVMDIEEEFSIDIPDQDVHGLKTVGQLVHHVEARIS